MTYTDRTRTRPAPFPWSGPRSVIRRTDTDKYGARVVEGEYNHISIRPRESVIHDRVLDNFAELQAAGALPINPLVKLDHILDVPLSISFTSKSKTTYTGYEDGRPVQVDLLTSIYRRVEILSHIASLDPAKHAVKISDLQERARTIASNNFVDSVNEAYALLLVSIKEFKATVKSIKDLRGSFFDSVKGLMGRLNTKTYQNLSDVWMGARYAYRPLAYEVAGLVSYLNDFQDRKAWQKVNAGHKLTEVLESTGYSNVPVFDDLGNHICNVSYTLEDVITINCRTGARWRPKVNISRESTRLGLRHTLSTAWDAMPLSFVVNWFLTMGPWLASFDVSGTIETSGSWASYDITMSRIAKDFYVAPTPNFGGNLPPDIPLNELGAEAALEVIRRKVRVPVDNPLDFAGVVVDVNLSPTKLLDLLFILNPFTKLSKVLKL